MRGGGGTGLREQLGAGGQVWRGAVVLMVMAPSIGAGARVKCGGAKVVELESAEGSDCWCSDGKIQIRVVCDPLSSDGGSTIYIDGGLAI